MPQKELISLWSQQRRFHVLITAYEVVTAGNTPPPHVSNFSIFICPHHQLDRGS